MRHKTGRKPVGLGCSEVALLALRKVMHYMEKYTTLDTEAWVGPVVR